MRKREGNEEKGSGRGKREREGRGDENRGGGRVKEGRVEKE